MDFRELFGNQAMGKKETKEANLFLNTICEVYEK